MVQQQQLRQTLVEMDSRKKRMVLIRWKNVLKQGKIIRMCLQRIQKQKMKVMLREWAALTESKTSAVLNLYSEQVQRRLSFGFTAFFENVVDGYETEYRRKMQLKSIFQVGL